MSISNSFQSRRGPYAQFDPGKLVEAEPAAVLSGDPSVPSGKAFYVCFKPGDVRRLVSIEDLTQMVERGDFDGPPGPPGAPGKDGTMKFDDLTESQKASLKGDKGDIGISVTAAEIDSAGSLILVLSDGNRVDSGHVVGEKGDRGQPGAVYTPALSETGVLSWTNDGGIENPPEVNIKGPSGPKGDAGTAFIPDVDANGNISWSNDGGLENPPSVNITGPPGPKGDPGQDGKMSFEDLTEAQKESLKGATFTPSVTESGDLSWTNNGGYTNPPVVNLKGPPGKDGEPGAPGKDGSPGAKGEPFTYADFTAEQLAELKGADGTTYTPAVNNGVLSWTNDGGKQNPESVNVQGDTPEIGENSNWFIGGLDTGKPSRGVGADLTQAAKSYWEDIAVPVDGTEVTSAWIDPSDMIHPNSSMIFLQVQFIINGVTHSFSLISSLPYANTMQYNFSATPSADSIKRTIQITLKTTGPVTYKCTAGSTSTLGDTTVRTRLIVFNVAYMQGMTKYDKVLANNSWEQIAEASKNGCANMLWNVGDEIDIELTGEYAQTLTLQIADFYYDALADGTGRAGITFVCKHLMKDKKRLHTKSSPAPKWDVSEMHKITLPAIMKCMSSELQNAIKLASKETAGDDSSAEPTKSTDYLFLLSRAETRVTSPSKYGEGVRYKIFDDTANKIKKLSNGSGEAGSYYLRPSPTSNSADIMMYNGGSGSTYDATAEYGVCFGFCV